MSIIKWKYVARFNKSQTQLQDWYSRIKIWCRQNKNLSINSSGCCCWCNGVGNIFLAPFLLLSTTLASFTSIRNHSVPQPLKAITSRTLQRLSQSSIKSKKLFIPHDNEFTITSVASRVSGSQSNRTSWMYSQQVSTNCVMLKPWWTNAVLKRKRRSNLLLVRCT